MPSTFSPAKHPPKAFDPESFSGPSTDTDGDVAARILQEACYQQYRQSDEILQSSFGELDRTQSKDLDIIPQSNGFVQTVTHAYNQHQALIIRPDDVWLAILVQFSSFINANAETMRSPFVRHKGKQELTVKADRDKVDYGEMARKMTQEIEKHVVDPVLRAWVLPDFTTSTANDTVVCSVVMMASMKKYFSFKFQLYCGIPRVTLDGEKVDWEKILDRLEKLKGYGLYGIAWYHLLHPIIVRFVRAFDAPDAQENIDFWQKVAHYRGGGSGPTYLTGWITAFCVFDDEGKWLGNPLKKDENPSSEAGSLSSADFFSTYFDVAPLPFGIRDFIEEEEEVFLKLDGVQYHIIDSQDVPSGYSEVEVLLEDDGSQYQCMMVAGAVGMRVSSSEEGGAKDTVQPVAGWWIFTKKKEGKFKDDRYEGEDQTPADLILTEENGPIENAGGVSQDIVRDKDFLSVEQKKSRCCGCIIM